MRIIIKGGRVIDPGSLDGTMDVYIESGTIAGLADEGVEGGPFGENDADRVIDAGGLIVAPGLVDMHVHLREPGEEYKETIETGIRAAAAGGFTCICCMPNTKPVNDCVEVTSYIVNRAESFKSVKVLPAAAASVGLKGEAITEYGELKSAGAVAVTDDGRPVSDSLLMRRVLEYASGSGLKVISHCEDLPLASGVVNEGAAATRLGLSGIPNAAESIMVMRDIALAELTGCPVHIAHVSTREAVREIRAAKSRGVPVTAETAPHYFTLTDDFLAEYNTYAKMYPPLRSEEDRKAVCMALEDGTIDAVATDHAPHSDLEKQLPFDEAERGIIGLETSLPLSLSLVEDGVLSFSGLIEKMSSGPARILGIGSGIRKGGRADLTLIDPSKKYSYYSAQGFSKSRNTPFEGREMTGCAVFTIVDGRIVYEAGRYVG